jgi:hypothetical protein
MTDLIQMDVSISRPDYIEELYAEFTETRIGYYIKKFKKDRAVSVDRIPAKFWKEFCSVNFGIMVLMILSEN